MPAGPRAFFRDTWRRWDAAAVAAQDALRSAGRYDYRPMALLLTASPVLTITYYLVNKDPLVTVSEWVAEPGDSDFWSTWSTSPFSYFYEYGFQVLLCVILFVLIPGAVWAAQSKPEFDAPAAPFPWVGTLALILIGGTCFLGAHELGVTAPFEIPPEVDGPREFLAWQALTAIEIVAIEFFYRGFWLAQLRGALGSHAVFAMAVPYTMIQYSSETFTMAWAFCALVSAVLLGTLAQKTRSIWSGFFVHYSVALAVAIWTR